MVLAEAYGYVIQFKSYLRCKERKIGCIPNNKWGLGENVVLQLIKCLPPAVSYYKYMGNYLTSFCLLTHLGVNKIRAKSVLNKNRLCKCNIIKDK